jgi:hypothetical protein
LGWVSAWDVTRCHCSTVYMVIVNNLGPLLALAPCDQAKTGNNLSAERTILLRTTNRICNIRWGDWVISIILPDYTMPKLLSVVILLLTVFSSGRLTTGNQHAFKSPVEENLDGDVYEFKWPIQKVAIIGAGPRRVLI